MIDLSKIVAKWPYIGGHFGAAPADFPFCKKGTRLQIRNNVMIGDYVQLGDWTNIEAGARVDSFTKLGECVNIGSGAIITSSTELGNGAVVPEYGQHTVDLGVADGFRKCISEVAGVAIITAGCRTFTLDEALNHWGHHHLNRDLTMCLLESAQAIARIRGWAFSHKRRPRRVAY